MITLPWADKFRELIDTNEHDVDIVIEFIDYIQEQEEKINEKWRKK